MFGDLRRFDNDQIQGMDWFRQLMDELFAPAGSAADIRSVPRGSFPTINVGHTDDAMRVYVFAPGLAADDFEVSVQDNLLTFKGRRETLPAQTEEEGTKRSYFRRERFQGEFSRALALPDGIDADRVEARFREGVLEVLLPKREELKPRRIEIQAA